jgi:hypothetical protein
LTGKISTVSPRLKASLHRDVDRRYLQQSCSPRLSASGSVAAVSMAVA